MNSIKKYFYINITKCVDFYWVASLFIIDYEINKIIIGYIKIKNIFI
ncbi:hypothetical protein VFMJ11_A1193 [Aliivibrio fischeri MJ11]|uniref:Uncharacterized protein n=1 Tax=Aliivibrio fischeri (strain MJ11) TaxID=388396 RepID=B5EVM0_ALIFM|nr:hypothetical protein VFMJ11_A1193 [Aliivibrio fischeri MJ11]